MGDLQSRIVEQEENVTEEFEFQDLPLLKQNPKREVSCQRYRLQGRSLSKRLKSIQELVFTIPNDSMREIIKEYERKTNWTLSVLWCYMEFSEYIHLA